MEGCNIPLSPLKPCPVCGKLTRGRCCSRPSGVAWNPLYKTQRWRKARVQFLDGHPFCQDCQCNFSNEIHHTVKSENETVFMDQSLWMALCKSCHSSRTKRGE